MNFTADTALGLDTQDGTLKAVLLARRGRKVELLRTWRMPYSHEPDIQAGRRLALRRFVNEARPGSWPRIVVAAPDRGHFSQTYLIPSMVAKRIDEMVRYEVLSALAIPEDELLLRYHVRKGVVECQVHTIALDKAQVHGAAGELRALKMPFDELQSPGYALASFVEHEIPLGRDRILLGVGELSTELVLLREDGLWTRHLPFGLAHETSEEALATRLQGEVEAAVSFLLPPDRLFRPADVVLTEEGALSPALTGALRKAFGVPVTRFDGLPRITVGPKARLGDQDTAQALSMGRAYGLALMGLGLGRFSCPALVADPRRRSARRLPLAAASLVVSAMGLAGVGQLAHMRVDALQSALPPSLTTEIQSNIAQRGRLSAKVSQLTASIAELDNLVARRGAALGVRPLLARLAQLAEGRGDDALHVESVWLAAPESRQPAHLKVSLAASPVFDDQLLERVTEVMAGSLAPWTLQGPVRDPALQLSRWDMEVELP
ncbi:MAG: hypothetical protein ACI9EF_001784 [Pseudohongiellaceae bacterium]